MKLYIVGFGPGNHDSMTFAAEKAILSSDLVVGYTTYTEIIGKLFPEKEIYSTPMKKERERVAYAFEKASEGKTVSIVCSGDSGVYAMAGLALEMSEKYPETEIEMIAGVTAALSGAAILGAPLSNDFAVISLSDLMTSREKIETRLEYASKADFTIVLYNPSSKKRADYLRKAYDIVLKYKDKKTVCGYVKNIGRENEFSKVLTLDELKNESADMFTTVFIGSSDTEIINGKMVTRRGYKDV